MKAGALVIFSGLPGGGKSTLAVRLASHINATYLRIDTIEQGLRDICEVSGDKGEGYRLAYRIAQENLRLGNTIIADSVNPLSLTRKEWNSVAQEVGANFVNIEIVCSDKSEHKCRIENRKSSVPGLKLPTWQEGARVSSLGRGSNLHRYQQEEHRRKLRRVTFSSEEEIGFAMSPDVGSNLKSFFNVNLHRTPVSYETSKSYD